MRKTPVLVTLMLTGMAFLVGCGGGGGSSAPTGTLSVRFGSDSFPGYQQAVVSIEKIECSADGNTWNPLGTVQATFDLMAVQNGGSAAILPATNVTAGTYNQFRITWATTNYQSKINLPAYVVPSGAAGQILTMPATTVIPGTVTVTPGGNVQAQVMLNGAQAVVATTNGASTTYRFSATGNAYDLSACGQITGKLTGGASALAGVEVYAETVNGLGAAILQRRAISNNLGNFTLEALPTGSVYYVAGQSPSWNAAASAPVNMVQATQYPVNLPLTTAASGAPGTLTIQMTPASSSTQATWGELRQSLATGISASQTFIVQSQTALINPLNDSVSFSAAPGLYSVTAQRSTAGGTPVLSAAGSQQGVTSGGSTTVPLTF